MHPMPEDVCTCEFHDVIIPPRNEYDARAALLGPDGGESYIIAQDRRFAILNNTEAAIHAASAATELVAALERELRAVERKLSWTASTITRPSSKSYLSWVNLLVAVLLSAAGALGMLVSNLVLSEYALRSAADLFANNRTGAVLFATLPCLGAVALKVFEARLVNANARWLYNAMVFAIGMVSLLAWLVAAAILFSPETAGSAVLLTQGSSDRWIGIGLVLTTIVCDVTLGATLLGGVGHLLSIKQNSEIVPNPECGALLKQKRQLELSLARVQRRVAEAKDYLTRAAAGRELTRREAEHDLERARELWTQAQSAAQAFAIARFLANQEDKPCDTLCS